jgi:hypothetical protein
MATHGCSGAQAQHSDRIRRVGGLTGYGDAGPEANALPPEFAPGLSEWLAQRPAIAFDFCIQAAWWL